MATKKIKPDVFDSVKPVWICPVTKKEFDPSDTKTIDKHKEQVLEDLKQKEEKANQTKIRNALYKELDNAKSMFELKDAFIKVVKYHYPDMKLGNLKLAILPTKSKFLYRAVVEVKGLTKKDYELLQTIKPLKNLVDYQIIHLGYNSDESRLLKANKTVGFQANSYITNAYSTYIVKTSKKLSKDELKALQSQKEYSTSLKSLSKISKQIQNLRKQASGLHKELDTIAAPMLTLDNQFSI